MQVPRLEVVHKFVHHPLPGDMIRTFCNAFSGHHVACPDSWLQLSPWVVGMVGLQLTEEELRLAKQWYVDGHAHRGGWQLSSVSGLKSNRVQGKGGM